MFTTVEEHLNWYKVNPNTGCWEYLGSPSKRYPQAKVAGKMVSLHRAAFEKYKRPLDLGEEPDHLCRNTRCINPDHLDGVTRKVNVHRGSNLKLTDLQIAEIRFLHQRRPDLTHGQLAQGYGVSRAHITRILNHNKRPTT